MKIKSKLKDSRSYENIYIEHDLPTKGFNPNMRTIVNAIGRDKLQVKGSPMNFKNTNSEDRTNINKGMHMRNVTAKTIDTGNLMMQ